ncbi:MAG TPA: aminotransferase class I/II-fold pyridoxal phosphate-dependent enzyme [Terriglobales bacterium]|nr:aminotransferase class I/II-fold pyridoxal phosphate-dependent enzyme [Terriglobales bacterium]
MILSRRSFFRMAGAASALTTLPLRSEVLGSFGPMPTATVDLPVRLDSNENPYGPSRRVLESMRGALSMANRYPRPEYQGLVEHIAAMHRVQPEQVLLGCGSSEILRVAAVASLGPGKKFVQASPTFETAERYAKQAGAAVIAVPLDREFAHDLDSMLSHLDPAAALLYICNPNNPTGSLTPRVALEAFLAKVPATTTVLIDEAYHHFATETPGYASFLDRPIEDDRIVVARTFSKVYGLAGMRLGYAIAKPALISRFRPHITPVNVNAVVVRAALVAMDDAEGVQDYVMKNAMNRREFFNQAGARGLAPIPSSTNFVMMDVHRPAQQVIEHFRKNQVWIGREFPPLETYVRVSLGKAEEMQEFWRVYDIESGKQASNRLGTGISRFLTDRREISPGHSG